MPPASSVASRRWSASPRGGSAAASRRSRTRRRSSAGRPAGSKVTAAVAPPHPLVDQPRGRPVERVVGLGQSGGAAGERRRVEPVGLGEPAAQAGAVEAVVLVARVGDRRRGPPPRRSRRARRGASRAAGGRLGRPRSRSRRGCRRGRTRPAPRCEAHQQGLGLVVGMVGGEQPADALARRPTRRAGGSAARGRADWTLPCDRRVGGEDGVRHAEPGADPGDEARPRRRFRGAGGGRPWRRGPGPERRPRRAAARRGCRARPRRRRRARPGRGAGQRLEIGAEAVARGGGTVIRASLAKSVGRAGKD